MIWLPEKMLYFIIVQTLQILIPIVPIILIDAYWVQGILHQKNTLKSHHFTTTSLNWAANKPTKIGWEGYVWRPLNAGLCSFVFTRITFRNTLMQTVIYYTTCYFFCLYTHKNLTLSIQTSRATHLFLNLIDIVSVYPH